MTHEPHLHHGSATGFGANETLASWPLLPSWPRVAALFRAVNQARYPTVTGERELELSSGSRREHRPRPTHPTAERERERERGRGRERKVGDCEMASVHLSYFICNHMLICNMPTGSSLGHLLISAVVFTHTYTHTHTQVSLHFNII